MATAAIIITTDNIDKTSEVYKEYDRYFDDVYIVLDKNMKKDLKTLFSKLDAEYIIITTDNEYYAEDGYTLGFYLQSHNLDFVVGNRTYTEHYSSLSTIYKLLNAKASKKASQLFDNYIPDILSTYYVFSKNFYKKFNFNKYFQLDCIKQSSNYSYIDVQYKGLTTYKSIRTYMNMIKNIRKD